VICLHVLDFPELAVARIELSSKQNLVYLRIEESATAIWLKVELHCVMASNLNPNGPYFLMIESVYHSVR
jgi:hypothetical protein